MLLTVSTFCVLLRSEIPPEVSRVIGDERAPRTRFSAAASGAGSLPLPGRPEVAFAGRSNVGKSSLINALTLSPVARQSDKPGKTQSLNFYDVAGQLTIVDMPGYGFAFAEEGKMLSWNSLMDEYLTGRGNVLKRVLVVLDARHGIKVNDREMLKFLSGANVKFQVVLNKTDMVQPAELARRCHVITEELATLRGANANVHMVSTSTGAGISVLAAELCRLAGAAPAARATTALPRKEALTAAGEAAPRRPAHPQPGGAAAAAAAAVPAERNADDGTVGTRW
jgi:GTP-binding protein